MREFKKRREEFQKKNETKDKLRTSINSKTSVSENVEPEAGTLGFIVQHLFHL